MKVADLITMLQELPLDAEAVIDDAATKKLLFVQTVEDGGGYVVIAGSYDGEYPD